MNIETFNKEVRFRAVDLVSKSLGDGYYITHPDYDCQEKTKDMLRQRLHRYSVAMKGNDLLVAKDAANHYWDFIDACDNKLSGYRGVEEKKSEDKEGK